jgi:hypothetical protein
MDEMYAQDQSSSIQPMGGRATAAASSDPREREFQAPNGRGYSVDPNQDIDVLPVRFRAIFPYPSFNRVQTKCFHPAYFGDENIVVAAPTGHSMIYDDASSSYVVNCFR